jgi:hypothetical protein
VGGGLGKGGGRGWDRERELWEEKEEFTSGLSKWEESVEGRGRASEMEREIREEKGGWVVASGSMGRIWGRMGKRK